MSTLTEMLQVTEQLALLFEGENALFGAVVPRELARALAQNEAEKRRLLVVYQRGAAVLRAKPVPQGPERVRLTALVERFLAALDEHRRKLGAMRQVTERLVKAITEAAQGPLKPVQTYTQHAVLRPAFRAKPVTAPLALNQRV